MNLLKDDVSSMKALLKLLYLGCKQLKQAKMYQLKQCLVLLGTLLLFSYCNQPMDQSGPRKLEILLLGHDSEHHNSEAYLPLLASALTPKGFNFSYSSDLDDLNEANLARYDALMVYANHDEIEPAQEKALLQFVKKGGGLLPIHSASFCFRNSEEYVELVGGQFKSHETGTFTAEIIAPDHPAMKGVEAFETWDETYVHDLHNKDRTVLMERVEGDEREPYTWVKEYGKGRMFYTALGHDERTWSKPGFHRLLEQGILWAVGEQKAEALAQLSFPERTYSEAVIPNYEKRDPAPLLQAPLGVEASQQLIQIPPGFELELFASEPDIVNPICMNWDERGRLWVVETRDYPNEINTTLHEGNDKIKILEDTDGDGKADKFTVFAEGLSVPTSLVFSNGGVIVSQAPYFLFLKHTDGDDKADVRYPILQGLGTADTHHAANNLVFGPDGGIYWQSGIFLVHNHETPWQQNLNVGGSGMYRFDPRTFAITPHADNRPNPHGTSFDYWGYCYANDGTGGKSYQVRPEGTGFKMHILLTKEFRPVAANAIMSSTHFPEDMQQDFLICNTIGFLGVKQYHLDREGDGHRKKFGEVWGTPGIELLDSEDRNFRPTDAVIGEDGALYVSDWHNAIIGHMQHNIRDPNRDHKHGRIFRLTVKGRPLQEPVKIHGQPIAALLDNLKHPVNGVRHRTRVELSGRDSDEVIAATREWMKDFDPNDETEAHHLLEALWVHQQHHVRDDALLETLLNSDVMHAANAAKTVQHLWYNMDLKKATGFAAPAESEFVNFNPPRRLTGDDRKAYQLGAQIYQRESHCATCHLPHGKGNGNIYPTLVNSAWVNGDEDRLIKATLHGLWGKMTVNGKTYDPSRGVPPMTAFRNLLNDEELAAVLTFVRNTWGNRSAPVSAASVKRVRAETISRSTFWKPDELLAEHPLEDSLIGDEPVQEEFSNDALQAELLAASPAELARTAMERGRLGQGRAVFYESTAACFACHDPPKGAARLGPDLKTIAKALTPEQLVDSILRPSQLIDEDYAQITVLDLDGNLHTGIRISEDDQEVVLRNIAAPEPIKINKDDIEAVKEASVSLMPENLARQLKSRQEFDDLMRYILEIRQR